MFANIVTTREEARAANQEQMSGIEADLDEDGINNIEGYKRENFTNPNGEKIDDMRNVDFVMFHEPSLKRQKAKWY